MAPHLCHQVHSSFSLLRGYQLFRGLGLRHLLVVDKHNRVLGMVTRIDLMQHRWGMAALLLAVMGLPTA